MLLGLCPQALIWSWAQALAASLWFLGITQLPLSYIGESNTLKHFDAFVNGLGGEGT